MKHVIAGIFAAMVAAATPALAGSAPDFGTLSDLIRKTKDVTAHPSGTAVAIVKDGRVIYEGYFGYRDIHLKAPVTRDTVFYIASATKPFIALDTLLREHQGPLSTGMSLQQMFPAVAFQDIEAREVTIRDLLVHTSGIDNVPLVWATAFSGVHDAGSRLGLVAQSAPHAEAGRGIFEYSNVGYNILSVWLDGQAGLPWQDQLDRAIFQPLGMQRTSAYISEAERQQWPLAKPYSLAAVEPGRPLYLAKADNTMHAAGGLVSTAPDLARFLLAQLASGDDPQLLPHAVIERSQSVQATLDSSYLDFQRTGYAWGWYTGEYKQRTMLHHFGGFAGFHAHMSFMPGENIGLVVLNNEDVLGARLTNAIADHVYGVLLGEPGAVPASVARFEELHAQAEKFRASVGHQRQEILAREWNLSQPRAAYAGTYTNELLGDMTVALNDRQEMVFRWGRLAATASGSEAIDHVRVEFVPNSGKELSFETAGGISSILFDGMEFVRTR